MTKKGIKWVTTAIKLPNFIIRFESLINIHGNIHVLSQIITA